jgi:hypothetical protein
MKLGLFSAIVLALILGTAACAQDATPPAGQPEARGQRGRGSWGGEGGMMGGRGTTGTVTAVAADHYTIRTEAGDSYTVFFSVNTRILKQSIQRRAPGQRAEADNREQAAPQTLKPSEIHAGDVIAAMGEVDAAAKSVGAVMVLLIDPERVKEMREMQANFGKTWLMGKVTAIDEARVSLKSNVDNAAHSFTANEDTTFRKRREPITLADIQVGDMVRVEGAVKDGVFVATAVAVMAMPPAGTPSLPRDGPPGAQPR